LGEKKKKRKCFGEIGVVEHACNPSTQEAEVGGCQIQGQPGLHSKTLSGKKKKKKDKKCLV
jgi:hypothetical protein